MTTNTYFYVRIFMVRLIKIEDSFLNNYNFGENKIENDESSLIKEVWLMGDSRIKNANASTKDWSGSTRREGCH